MDGNHCSCGSQQQISASAASNAQAMLRRLAPKQQRGSKHDESLVFQDGRFAATLTISQKKDDPKTILVAIPESLGTMVVKAVPKKTRGSNKMSFHVEVHAGVSSAKTVELIGQADLQIDTSEENVGARLKVLSPSGGDPKSTFRKKIDWDNFYDCALTYCIAACFFGLCVNCLIACAVGSVVDAD